MVQVGRVRHADDLRHLAARAELRHGLGPERAVAAAHEHVRHEAGPPELGDAVLRGLRLLLAADLRDERHVHDPHAPRAEVRAHRPQRLQEELRLDVADRPAELDEAHLGRLPRFGAGRARRARRRLNHLAHEGRAVGHVLHGAAQVVPPALAAEELPEDPAGRDAARAGQPQPHEALVATQVEVHLAAVVQHEDLAVLLRAHRPRVDVEVRVDLHGRHAHAALAQKRAQGRDDGALAKPAHDPAGHDDVLHPAVSWSLFFFSFPSSPFPLYLQVKIGHTQHPRYVHIPGPPDLSGQNGSRHLLLRTEHRARFPCDIFSLLHGHFFLCCCITTTKLTHTPSPKI